MLNYNYILSIDPDTEKSGVAELLIAEKSIISYKLTLSELIEYLRNYAMSEELKKDMIVIVEGGFLNQSNFHLRAYINNKYASRIGHDVGRNHQVALDIIEIVKSFGFQVKVVRPLRKIWAGKDGKITTEELEKVSKNNGYSIRKKRMNQDERDAILLALAYGIDNLKM